jgi:hypothetical protein
VAALPMAIVIELLTNEPSTSVGPNSGASVRTNGFIGNESLDACDSREACGDLQGSRDPRAPRTSSEGVEELTVRRGRRHSTFLDARRSHRTRASVRGLGSFGTLDSRPLVDSFQDVSLASSPPSNPSNGAPMSSFAFLTPGPSDTLDVAEPFSVLFCANNPNSDEHAKP